jgi:hypothetical protein
MASINTTLQVVPDKQSQALEQLLEGKNVEPTLEEPQSSNYEYTHASHSPWVSPPSWNKVPKVDMHKFDGYNPTGWVSQMEQYFSLHDIQDDETKDPCRVFLLGSRILEVVAVP